MRIEGRDLVDLGLRKLHLGGERREMRGGEVTVAVLDQMQMLDQQIAPARLVAEQAAPRRRRGSIWRPLGVRRGRFAGFRPAGADGVMLIKTSQKQNRPWNNKPYQAAIGQ